MDFLSNSWFIGIAGGVISGIIVFFITAFITGKISKKEYFKTVNEVNTKISKMLIMSISENKIPTPEIVEALLSSLAKRNNILLKDINTVEETYNDLISELYETNFIPVEKKQSLANELISVKSSLKQPVNLEEIKKDIETQGAKDLRLNRLKYLYILVTISMAYFALIGILVKDTKYSWLFFPENSTQIFKIAGATFAIVLSLLMLITTKKMANDISKKNKS